MIDIWLTRMTAANDVSPSELSFLSRSRSAPVASPGQFPEVSTADTSLFSPSIMDGAGDFNPQDSPCAASGETIWTPINAVEYSTVGPCSELQSLGPRANPPASSESSDSCNCLLSAMSFLEKLVSKHSSSEDRMDWLLAQVRNATETFAVFVGCERCVARAEQKMLLAMAARQISILCRKMAGCYEAMRRCSRGDASSPQYTPLELDASAGSVNISVSTYRVSRRESLYLLKSLISFQLAEFQQHIDTLKLRNRNRPNQGQEEALTEAEMQVRSAQMAISG